MTLVAHADWSKDPAKRWLAIAVLQPDQRWLVTELVNAPEPSQFFPYLSFRLPVAGCLLAGFDFPIGLPSTYAAKANLGNFLTALERFGQADWSEFYLPADTPSEISLHRPFYPARPGNSCRQHLVDGLDLPFSQLYRLCETAHQNRRSACPLFWTMGGQQVGKAAISGWQSLLAPAITNPDLHLHIWPFSGPIRKICQPGYIVVVESYPAEYYAHLGLSFSTPTRRSKRRHADRLAFAHQLMAWANAHSIDLDPAIVAKIQAGFGNHPDGEDQFDALVGLYGMINVVLGHHPINEPSAPLVTTIEGWIFGQDSS